MSKDTSPPAFPLTEDAVNHRNKDFPMQGMTIRQWYAGMALQGVLSSCDHIKALNEIRGPMGLEQACAQFCFEFADAMLKESQK